jgi:hypothetical protein
MEPSTGIEPVLSPLPRACFTTKLRRRLRVWRRYSIDGLRTYLGARHAARVRFPASRIMGRAGGRFDRVYFSLASLLRHFPNRVARRRGNGASGSRAANAPTNSRQDRDDRRQQIRRENQRRELQRLCEHDVGDEAKIRLEFEFEFEFERYRGKAEGKPASADGFRQHRGRPAA